MKKSVSVLMLAICASVLSACGGGSSDRETVVLVNETATIPDGAFLTYTIPAVYASVEISASTNGVIVEWIGGGYAASAEVKTYKGSCGMAQQGQHKITNPATSTGDEVVTVKITTTA